MVDVMDINQRLFNNMRSISDDNSEPKKGEVFHRRNGAWVSVVCRAEIIDIKDGQVLFIETPYINNFRVPVSCSVEDFMEKFARAGDKING